MPRLLSEPSASTAQLERPQEVVDLLEVRPNSVDLVDKVLNTDNVILPKGLHGACKNSKLLVLAGHCTTNIFNDGVFSERSSSTIYFPKSSLVYQLTHSFQVRISEMIQMI